MSGETAAEAARDPSEGFAIASAILSVALYVQMVIVTDGGHPFHPDKIALAALTGAFALMCIVSVQTIRQWAFERAHNITAFVPALALAYAWWVWRQVFAVNDPLPSMHVDTLIGTTGIPMVFRYVMPAVIIASVATGIYALVRRLPILLDGSTAPAPAPGQVARAAQPQSQNTQAKPAEPGPRDRWPAKPARFNFASMHGNVGLKEELARAAEEWRGQGRNGILLYGPPGTGKTMAAEALAGQLGLGFINVTFGNLASKWINQTTEQVIDVFRAAHQQGPVVLFLDELDAIITDRGSGSDGYAEYQRVTTTFLTEAVNLRGTGVLLVTATNYLDRLDDAAVREGRFDFKVQVPLPDAEARYYLIQQVLFKYKCQTTIPILERLVRRWGGFNVPRLQLAASRACEARNVDRSAGKQSQEGQPLLSQGLSRFSCNLYRPNEESAAESIA